MKPVRTITLRPPSTRKRANWALLLFLALALGAATAGLLNQQSGRPAPTAVPSVVVTVPGGSTGEPAVGLPTGTPTAAAVPTLPTLPGASLGVPAPTATVTVLPPRPGSVLLPGTANPSPTRAPTRGPSPTATRTPTRTPTPSPTASPTPSSTASPTPLVASPAIAAVATGSSYRAGAYVRGKVVVSGLPTGYAGDAVLQLHGPFPSSVEINCAAGSVVRNDTIRVTGDGTWSGPAKAIRKRGFYVWEAVLPGGPSSHAASSTCPTRSGRFEVTW